MARRKRIELSEHIVSDPEICGGDLTFRGTRVLVKDALYYLAEGEDWDWIVAAYRNSFPREAVAEAINLANEALTGKLEKRRRAA